MKGLSGRKPKSVQQPGHFFREQPGQAPNCSRWRHSRTEVRLYLASDDKPLAGHMPWDPPKADLNQRASRLLWSAAVAECLLPLQNVPLDNQTVWVDALPSKHLGSERCLPSSDVRGVQAAAPGSCLELSAQPVPQTSAQTASWAQGISAHPSLSSSALDASTGPQHSQIHAQELVFTMTF